MFRWTVLTILIWYVTYLQFQLKRNRRRYVCLHKTFRQYTRKVNHEVDLLIEQKRVDDLESLVVRLNKQHDRYRDKMRCITKRRDVINTRLDVIIKFEQKHTLKA